MKTWITYTAAAALGFAARFFFADAPQISSLLESLVPVLSRIFLYAAIPLVSITLAAGTASCLRPDRKKDKKGFLTFFFWTVLTLLLSFSAGIAASAFQSAVGADSLPETVKSSGTLPLLPKALLICIPFSVLAGFAFRPTSNIYVPAYNILNSLSEVCYRIFKGVSRYFFLPLFIFSSSFAQKDVPFALNAVVLCAALILILLPLLFALFTSFKVNPYRLLFLFLPSLISSFFTMSLTTSLSVLYSNARNNAGAQKRFVSAALPFSFIFTRGGTAAFAVFTALTLAGTAGAAGASAAGASAAAALPLLASLSAMTDAACCLFTVCCVSYKKEGLCRICANDRI